MYRGECYLTQRSVPVIILVYYNKDFDFLRYYHYSVRLRWTLDTPGITKVFYYSFHQRLYS